MDQETSNIHVLLCENGNVNTFRYILDDSTLLIIQPVTLIQRSVPDENCIPGIFCVGLS